jgi:REP element-mobilizing transposase RayT
MMDQLPKRKYIRLPLPMYANPAHVFFITIDTPNRERFFDQPDFNRAIVRELQRLAKEKRCPVKIYCLMPTHLHLVMSAGSISVVRWIALFKQRTQDLAEGRGLRRLWQRSFYDHRLRPTEREADAIEYVRLNPVQAGLVRHPDDWPWIGSVLL